MGVSFYIKPTKKEVEVNIYCSVNFKELVRFTFRVNNIVINKKDWSQGRMITGKGKIDNGRVQSFLERLQKGIEEYYEFYFLETSRPPTKKDILEFIRSGKNPNEFIRPSKSVGILPLIAEIISDRKSGKQLNEGKFYSENTIKTYEKFYCSLKEFEDYRELVLNSTNVIQEELILEFQNFLTIQKDYQLNTVGERLKHLKTFLQVLFRKKVIKSNPFIEFDIPIPKEETVNIALSENDLKEMEELDLSHNQTAEKVRDQFILMCWTGLRISDFKDFIDVPKVGTIITVTNQKTNQQAYIPLFPQSQKIIDKYKGKLPSLISEQRMRDYLKGIGKDIKSFNNIIDVEFTKGGKRVKTKIKRYSLLSLHTARRTLATNLYRKGVALSEIMLITGHKSERSLKLYLKVTESEVLLNVLKKVEDSYNQSQLVTI